MRTYNILDYGAIEADLLQTKAIQAAIDDCFLAGGGEVIIPSGIYRTGGLRIRSNVVLHLLQGAILEGSGNPDDYTAWKEDKLEPVDFSDIEPSKYRSATRTSRWNNVTEFRLRNVRLSARNGIKSQIFIDAENCSRIELTNVKLEGYTSPKLVLRSECEVIINACDDFELERGFCENACEQCDRKGQMPEGEYNV